MIEILCIFAVITAIAAGIGVTILMDDARAIETACEESVMHMKAVIESIRQAEIEKSGSECEPSVSMGKYGVQFCCDLKIECDDDLMPERKHAGDAGLDLKASRTVRIGTDSCVLVETGVRAVIPDGCVGLVFPRSGLGSKGLTLRNAVGVIDSGYRGEIKAALWNKTGQAVTVNRGDRIAQLVVMPYVQCEIVRGTVDDDTERGTDGHGSTGTR